MKDREHKALQGAFCIHTNHGPFGGQAFYTPSISAYQHISGAIFEEIGGEGFEIEHLGRDILEIMMSMNI
jgi:hypothetical protein